MQPLKSHSIFKLACATLLLLIVSCNNDSPIDPTPTLDGAIKNVRQTVMIELIVNDLESLVLNAFINLGLQDPGGSVDSHIDYNIFSQRGNCAREIDTENNRITLDLSSCLDGDEILREGELLIDYEDAYDRPGNLIEVQLNGYTYEKVGLDGSFIIRNTSELDSEIKNYEIIFLKTSLAFENSTEDFDFSGTRLLEIHENHGSIRDPDIESNVLANWTVSGETIATFDITTTSPVQHRMDCWSEGFYFPRGGTQLVSNESLDLTIDYQKGSCGWELTVIDANAISQNFTLLELFNN